MFTNRFLLFDDAVCVGLFVDKNIKTSILISSTGDFVQISREEDVACHLTRFVPSRFAVQVQELIQFRNTYAQTSFACERFLSTNIDNNDDNDDIKKIKHEASSCLCPFGKRVIQQKSLLYHSDKVIDIGHHDNETSVIHEPLVTSLKRIFAINMVSNDVLDSENRGQHRLHYTRDTGSASIAQDLFTTLGAEMTWLFTCDTYPSPNEERYVVVEMIDDCVYTLNSTFRNDYNESIGITIDAWLHPYDSGTMLSLHEDYITLYWLEDDEKEGNTPKACEQEIHLTLLDFNVTNEYSEHLQSDSHIDRFHMFRTNIVQMLNLRKYLTNQRPTLERREKHNQNNKMKNNSDDIVMLEPIQLCSDGIRYTALHRSINGKQDIYKIHGVFPDHTMLELDTSNGNVIALLPTGESQKFDLISCLSSRDSEVIKNEEQLFHTTPKQTRQYYEPSSDIVRHVKSLLAFRRWAATPSDQRHSLVMSDRKISTIAQASVLEAQRFLLLQNLRSGNIHHDPAAKESRSLQKSLHFSGRDLHPDLYPSDPLDTKMSAKMTGSSAQIYQRQQIKVDPLQHRQAVQRCARDALAGNQTFLEESEAFFEKCQAKPLPI
jgi:hypothetical protein